MVKALNKLVYKPDTQSTDEFVMIVNDTEVCHCLFASSVYLLSVTPFEYKKWKDGGE